MNKLIPLALAFWPALSHADSLNIVVDVAPVRALVRSVAGDSASVTPLVGPSADPHAMALRPSQIRTLARADLIVATSPQLTPWLVDVLHAVVPSTPVVWLDHDHLDEEAGQHDHDDHSSHAEEDPHLWMDLEIASELTEDLAKTLAALRPEDAAKFAAAEASSQATLRQEAAQFAAFMDRFGPRAVVVSHNSWSAVSDAFGLNVVGYMSDGHHAAPGPAHVAQLRKKVADLGVRCFVKHPNEPAATFAPLNLDDTAILVSANPEGEPAPGTITVLPALMETLQNCHDQDQ